MQDIKKMQFVNNQFLAGVIIPVVKIGETEFILLQKRSQQVSQPGDIAFPGGKFDLSQDNSLKETAIREFHEEIGGFAITLMRDLKHHISAIGAIIQPWVARFSIENASDLAFSKQEVDELVLIELDKLLNDGLTEYDYHLHVKSLRVKSSDSVDKAKIENHITQYIENRNHSHIGYAYILPNGDIIWGVTGEILHAFIEDEKQLRRHNKW